MERGSGPQRVCPLCAVSIPQFRALCGHCFRIVPWMLRADFLRAYQRRIRDRPGYEEKLADLLLWKKSFDGRNGGEKDL